jgi:DNA modification methylase
MVARQGRIRGVTRIQKGLRLAWPGRAWDPGPASITEQSPAPWATTTETAPGREGRQSSKAPLPCTRIVHGDALDVARILLAEGLGEKVDVVYLDPPFASQSAYTYEARLDGRADGRVLRSRAYDDRWEGNGIASYLDMLAPRLDAATRLLAPSGTIWVHVDYRASYLVRLLLDEIMGRDAFVNEIVWRRAPNLGRQAASRQFGRTLDTIVVYGAEEAVLTPPTRLEPIEARAVRRDAEGRPFIAAPRGDYTDDSIARLDLEGRVHRTSTGKVYVKYFLVPDHEGNLCRERRVDALWTDVPPLRHARPEERTGFPTQKPRALLDRILACACPPAGLVVDLFAGSGTTAESAHALGRSCVISDISPVALAMARARLLRAGAPVTIQRCATAVAHDAPKPHVAIERRREGLRVELLAPTEPLAWAIDVARDEAVPFHTTWHSERMPGTKAHPVLREASLPHSPGPIGVWVWNDDGSVGMGVTEAP